MIDFEYTNNAKCTLWVSINETATTIVLAWDYWLLPTANGKLTLIQRTDGAVTKREIIRYATRTGTTLTGVTRAYEACTLNDWTGTTLVALAQTFSAWDEVQHVMTALDISNLLAGVKERVDKSGDAMTGQLKLAKGTDIASASSIDLWAGTGNYIVVTGTTGITALGTAQAGTTVTVRFTGILTITHNATSLIIPGGNNITTAVNDVCTFMSEGSGNWRVVNYFKADGSSGITSPLIDGESSTLTCWENITTWDFVYTSIGTGSRTAGRVYKAKAFDATFTDSFRFVWVAKTTATTWNPVIIQTSWVYTTSSLTAGAPYYLTNTFGTISTTPGSRVIMVWRAISTTQLQIESMDYNKIADVVNSSKNLADATWTQTISHSLGFVPRSIQAFGLQGTSRISSWSYSSFLAKNSSTSSDTSSWTYGQSATNILEFYNSWSGTNWMVAQITAVTNTDFTVTWTKNWSATGTAYITWTIS